MSRISRKEIEEIDKRMATMPPAPWVQKMIAHYQKHGTYRALDLRRLLGDPTQSVSIGTKEYMEKQFLKAVESSNEFHESLKKIGEE